MIITSVYALTENNIDTNFINKQCIQLLSTISVKISHFKKKLVFPGMIHSLGTLTFLALIKSYTYSSTLNTCWLMNLFRVHESENIIDLDDGRMNLLNSKFETASIIS